MDDFNKLLEKATNDELKGLWQQVMFMDFINDCNGFVDRVITGFESEIRKRLSNGTMVSEISDFPTDWDLFVNCCK
jgi:hypothetical protein